MRSRWEDWVRVAVCAMGLGPSVAHARPESEILALHVNANFSAKSVDKPWSASIKRKDGSTAFVLSLAPDFDVGHNVVVLDLVLHRPSAKADDTNLLAPTPFVHGLQAYVFAAGDFVGGVEASTYGRERVIAAKGLGLVVDVQVLKAVVSKVSKDDFGMESLELQIDVRAGGSSGAAKGAGFAPK